MSERHDGRDTVERLQQKFPDAVTETGSYRDQHWVRVTVDAWLEVAEWLRDDPANDYAMLTDVTAVHWPDEPQPMELVYHLFSLSRNDRLRVKVRTDDRGPAPTLCGLWRAADWNEREAYDMFGIDFEGHPDLRRILMNDEYTDFPLRKELPLYRG